MNIKHDRKSRASRVVMTAAIAALGAGAVATQALAIEDDGKPIEESALLLHGHIAGLGESGFYIDYSAFLPLLMAPYILFHKALITPVWFIGNAGQFFEVEGYEDQ